MTERLLMRQVREILRLPVEESLHGACLDGPRTVDRKPESLVYLLREGLGPEGIELPVEPWDEPARLMRCLWKM
jgi:hypothetical protein